MAIRNLKKFFDDIDKKLKSFDFNSFNEKIRNFKIQDIKNINYKSILYHVRTSKYSKPVFGIASAVFMTMFVLVPKVKDLNFSLKTMTQYREEAKKIDGKIVELKIENQKFELISELMNEINSSILKNKDVIFITQLLNDAAKKSNVNISSFKPLIKADSTKLCKDSLSQKNSKKFSKRKRNSKSLKKGNVQSNFFEVNFSSDYLDIINFLKEIQLYDLVIVPYCLEVDSEQIKSSQVLNDTNEDESLIIPLNKLGEPIEAYLKSSESESESRMNLSNVSTRIILKIPTTPE